MKENSPPKETKARNPKWVQRRQKNHTDSHASSALICRNHVASSSSSIWKEVYCAHKSHGICWVHVPTSGSQQAFSPSLFPQWKWVHAKGEVCVWIWNLHKNTARWALTILRSLLPSLCIHHIRGWCLSQVPGYRLYVFFGLNKKAGQIEAKTHSGSGTWIETDVPFKNSSLCK